MIGIPLSFRMLGQAATGMIKESAQASARSFQVARTYPQSAVKIYTDASDALGHLAGGQAFADSRSHVLLGAKTNLTDLRAFVEDEDFTAGSRVMGVITGEPESDALKSSLAGGFLYLGDHEKLMHHMYLRQGVDLLTWVSPDVDLTGDAGGNLWVRDGFRALTTNGKMRIYVEDREEAAMVQATIELLLSRWMTSRMIPTIIDEKSFLRPHFDGRYAYQILAQHKQD